jgi:hypothetical protein
MIADGSSGRKGVATLAGNPYLLWRVQFEGAVMLLRSAYVARCFRVYGGILGG